MKNIILLYLLTLILTSCSGDGNLEIINRTKNEIYFSIENTDYILTGSNDPDTDPEAISIKLSAGKDFLNNPEKSYTLFIEGETFAIYDYVQHIVVPSTEIVIKSGEVTTVYCNPGYACVRLINNSLQDISSAWYIKSTNSTPALISGSVNLAPTQSTYCRLDYMTDNPNGPEDYLYYIFQVILRDSTLLEFGDETNYLFNDDLYQIIIE
ncbi:MAG: hypothetical protein K9N06_00400 [Candidatus Cloacimonetes bacterium]|nr:hypothetical protein [Candidatus Cloacimonadota bacterium]